MRNILNDLKILYINPFLKLVSRCRLNSQGCLLKLKNMLAMKKTLSMKGVSVSQYFT